MDFTLHIWRQAGKGAEGHFERHFVDEIDPDASFLEMLDILNERVIEAGGSASPSTPTAARESAAPAPWSSTAPRTARAR